METGAHESVLEDRWGGDATSEALAMMSDGALILSETGVISHANPALEQQLACSPGSLAGQGADIVMAFSPEENGRLLRVMLDQALQSGSWSGSWALRRAEGAAMLASFEIRPIEWGGKRCFLCIQRKEETPSPPPHPRDEQRLAIATEAAELGVWEWELATDTFIYSQRARTICGFSALGPITYADVSGIVHPADLPHTLAKAKRALDPAIRERTPYQYRIIRPDGALRWVRAHGYAVFTDDGDGQKAARYVGTIEDITDRVERRAAEIETARQVRLALESARMAIWSVDLENQTLRSSPELNELFGFARDAQPTLQELEARHAPGHAERMNAQWNDALAKKAQTHNGEFAIDRLGEQRWLRVRCDIQYFEDGRPQRAVGVVMDVTEQRLAQEALRESDARFREAADSAPSPVWMTNSDGKVEFGNQAMAEFAGSSVEEVMGDAWLARMHPEDIGRVVAVRAKAWEDGHAPYTVEARFKRADGAWRWLEINSRARRDATGTFKGYVGLAVDRTEAHELIASITESEERFRLLADSAPVMIWMSKSDGACLYLNAALRRFWGVQGNDLGAFDWRSTMHPEDEARITAEVMHATTAQTSFSVEGRYRNAEGQFRIFRTQGVPRFAPTGEFLGMIGVNIDLTDLLDAQSHHEVLLAELNHRVKNTLAVVQSLAKQTFRSGVEMMDARGIFDARLQSMAGAHTLLTRSNWENARLQAIVEQAVQVCGDGRTRIVWSGPDLLLNPKQALSISLALHELCTNAVKHGALRVDGGRIDVGWSSENGVLNIRWREQGGPLVEAPERRGFGSVLLERVLPKDIGGEGKLGFAADGVTYDLSAPMDLR